MTTLESFSKKSISTGTIYDYPVAIVRHDRPERTWAVLQSFDMPLFWFCAYVGLDKSHPYHGKHFIDPPVSQLLVHGGLTFSDWHEDLWVLGWDYGHYDSPHFETNDTAIVGIVPDIISLVEQLRVIEQGSKP
jgi:hypothetical protein